MLWRKTFTESKNRINFEVNKKIFSNLSKEERGKNNRKRKTNQNSKKESAKKTENNSSYGEKNKSSKDSIYPNIFINEKIKVNESLKSQKTKEKKSRQKSVKNLLQKNI